VALVCDALVGNYQQKVLSRGTSVDELMLFQVTRGVYAMY
jgi:hypothetical protein